MFGLSGEDIHIPIPATTTRIEWDPDKLWSVYEEHLGAQHKFNDGHWATFAIIDRCIQTPSPAHNSLQKIGTGILEVRFDPKPGRHEENCKYDFANMETSAEGYVVSGEALTRGVFRLFQGDNSTYYDQTVR
jgi:hypothetical protein